MASARLKGFGMDIWRSVSVICPPDEDGIAPFLLPIIRDATFTVYPTQYPIHLLPPAHDKMYD
jgi:hypothetical protein